MKKLLKVLLGLLTVSPLVWLVLVIVWAAALLAISGPATEDGLPEAGLLPLWPFVLILYFGAFPLAAILVISYLVFVFITERLAGSQRILWAVLLVILSIFSMPVFWYCYVWKEPNGEQSDAGPT